MAAITTLKDIRQGAIFATWDALKLALNSQIIRDKFTYRTPKKTPGAATYTCKEAPEYPWKIRVSRLPEEVIRVIEIFSYRDGMFSWRDVIFSCRNMMFSWRASGKQRFDQRSLAAGGPEEVLRGQQGQISNSRIIAGYISNLPLEYSSIYYYILLSELPRS